MAGGRFDKAVGKVRPGTYMNFESGGDAAPAGTGARGTVIVPLPKASYGPGRQFIRLTSDSPDAEAAALGYSIYDSDPNRQMLLIREAFKRAATVYVYMMGEGSKATAEITMAASPAADPEEEAAQSSTNTLTAAAKYGGTRGNSFTVTVDANPMGGYDVLIHLDGAKVAEYSGLTTVEELVGQGNPYLDFKGSGSLGEAAGTTLSGGTDEDVTNADISAFIDAWEDVRFNAVCFPFDGPEAENIKQAALAKIKYMRDSMGRGVQAVIPNAGPMDYEGVINVTNSVFVGDDRLSVPEACAWVTGATAGVSYTESLTYSPYEGATAVANPKSSEEAVAAIKAGEFFFSVSEQDEVVVEYDINSLTTFTEKNKKNKSYRKNRVIRVFDAFQESVKANFPPNKFDNDSRGWDIMEGLGATILKLFDDAKAITNVDYSRDFLVDREASRDDETYFKIGLQPVDSSEKLYFTVSTR